jgi:hypothetical protein
MRKRDFNKKNNLVVLLFLPVFFISLVSIYVFMNTVRRLFPYKKNKQIDIN